MQDNHYSLEAERSVLGALMSDYPVALDACLRLRPEHFFLASHRSIFSTCQRLLGAHTKLDLLAVRTALGTELDGLGGMAYLSELTEGIYRGFDPSQRVDSIIEKWKLRRGIQICSNYSARFDGGDCAEDTLAALQADVFDAIQDAAEHDDPHVDSYTDAALNDLMERATAPDSTGLSYGLDSLDAWTGGMHPGQVTVCGARSGVGKTSLMKQATVANASKGIPVALFSLEASRSEVLEGLWAIVSGIEARKVSRPHLLTHDERTRLASAAKMVRAWPLRIYDNAQLTIDQIVALARMNVRAHGAKLICVDYAQSVEAEGKDERTKVQAVSRKLTKMAKSEQCALMLLSQLRKMPHEQYSRLPTAADLRETGQLENDAHVIVLLHRGWDDENQRISNDATIIIPKIRRGQTGALPAHFNPADLRFESRSRAS